MFVLRTGGNGDEGLLTSRRQRGNMPLNTWALIYCGRCGEYNAMNPPESWDCPHFSRQRPDEIWLAVGGAVIRDSFNREDRLRTKYFLHEPFRRPGHSAFQRAVHEKSQSTFKIPIAGQNRVHFEETPQEGWFAAVHGPETDPDPPATPIDKAVHGVAEVLIGYNLDKFRNRVDRVRGVGNQQDPLYVYPEDRDLALDYAVISSGS